MDMKLAGFVFVMDIEIINSNIKKKKKKNNY
jgi:hypothetical protein